MQSGEGSPNGLSANELESSTSAGSPKRLEASQEQVKIQTKYFLNLVFAKNVFY